MVLTQVMVQYSSNPSRAFYSGQIEETSRLVLLSLDGRTGDVDVLWAESNNNICSDGHRWVYLSFRSPLMSAR